MMMVIVMMFTMMKMIVMMKMMMVLNIARNLHFTRLQKKPTWKLTENQGLLKLARQYGQGGGREGDADAAQDDVNKYNFNTNL